MKAKGYLKQRKRALNYFTNLSNQSMLHNQTARSDQFVTSCFLMEGSNGQLKIKFQYEVSKEEQRLKSNAMKEGIFEEK